MKGKCPYQNLKESKCAKIRFKGSKQNFQGSFKRPPETSEQRGLPKLNTVEHLIAQNRTPKKGTTHLNTELLEKLMGAVQYIKRLQGKNSSHRKIHKPWYVIQFPISPLTVLQYTVFR